MTPKQILIMVIIYILAVIAGFFSGWSPNKAKAPEFYSSISCQDGEHGTDESYFYTSVGRRFHWIYGMTCENKAMKFQITEAP